MNQPKENSLTPCTDELEIQAGAMDCTTMVVRSVSVRQLEHALAEERERAERHAEHAKALIIENGQLRSYAVSLQRVADAAIEWVEAREKSSGNMRCISADSGLRDAVGALAKNPSTGARERTTADRQPSPSGGGELAPTQPTLPLIADGAIKGKAENVSLTVPFEPTPEMIAAAEQTPGMKELDGFLATMSLSRHFRLGWGDRGEQPPLVQAWKAMVSAAAKCHQMRRLLCSRCGKPVAIGNGESQSDWGDNVRCYPSCGEKP